MSPRAAWRLDHLGFSEVWDYVPGKMDWLSFDLPYEGDAVLVARAVDRGVPRCRLDARVADLADAIEETGTCVVVNDHDVVMGTLDGHALHEHPDATAADAMRFGVTTVRPSEELSALLERMQRRDVNAVLVTRQDGVLVGALRAGEAEAHLEALP